MHSVGKKRGLAAPSADRLRHSDCRRCGDFIVNGETPPLLGRSGHAPGNFVFPLKATAPLSKPEREPDTARLFCNWVRVLRSPSKGSQSCAMGIFRPDDVGHKMILNSRWPLKFLRVRPSGGARRETSESGFRDVPCGADSGFWRPVVSEGEHRNAWTCPPYGGWFNLIDVHRRGSSNHWRPPP
jgi:hypothetical protein